MTVTIGFTDGKYYIGNESFVQYDRIPLCNDDWGIAMLLSNIHLFLNHRSVKLYKFVDVSESLTDSQLLRKVQQTLSKISKAVRNQALSVISDMDLNRCDKTYGVVRLDNVVVRIDLEATDKEIKVAPYFNF